MCHSNTVCELFLNHEERLKQYESRLCNLFTLLNQLRAGLSQLQSQVSAITQPLNSLRVILMASVGTTVTILTDVGSVTGILILVGDDFVEILESTGNFVFITLSSIVSF